MRTDKAHVRQRAKDTVERKVRAIKRAYRRPHPKPDAAEIEESKKRWDSLRHDLG